MDGHSGELARDTERELLTSVSVHSHQSDKGERVESRRWTVTAACGEQRVVSADLEQSALHDPHSLWVGCTHAVEHSGRAASEECGVTSVCVRVCLSVCVREVEREKERKREGEEREGRNHARDENEDTRQRSEATRIELRGKMHGAVE